MLNLRRLKYLKEHNANDSLQFVAQYILNKIQRDKSEFSRYAYDEDWSELEQYLHQIEENKRPKDLKIIKRMLHEISEEDNNISSEIDFEKSLLNRVIS
jgi:hypothetical protein